MNRYLSEFIGTFALVFCGTGAIVINEETGGTITHAGIAVTFGLIVMAMIYTFGEISGAHLNSAVTIAFALACKFPIRNVIPYLLSQLAGAFLASLLLMLLFPNNENLGATNPAGSIYQTFILEYILTFFLMLVIINVATGGKEQGMFAGLAIGATILLEAMFAGPITGASMNPARSLAPAILSGKARNVWIYVIAPMLGAASSIPVYKITRNNKTQ
jgi:aquaporin Z